MDKYDIHGSLLVQKPVLGLADLELLNVIRTRGGAMTVRELMSRSRRYRPASVALAALTRLVHAGHGKFRRRRTRGRTAYEFALWSLIARD
jgi:hypothetical protein